MDGIDIYTIMGQPNDVAILQRIIDQIDKLSLEYEPVIELVQIKQADSLRVCNIVQQLYQQIYASRRGQIIVLPLVKPNTILMVGKKENLDTAKELVGKLDLVVDPKSQFRIFRLKNAQAETLQQQIQNFYQYRISNGYLEQQVNVVADARTNALIVQANPRDFKEVETLVNQLDVKGSETKNIVRTFTLKNAIASELATTLQNTITGTSTGGNFGTNTANSSQSRSPLWVMLDDKNKSIPPVSTLYDIRISADTRSNTIIVSAPPDTMVLIEMLITQLDQLPTAESEIKIFTLINADAYATATMLQNLFSNTSTSGGGFGGTGTTNNTNVTLRRPGIEQNESSLISVRFVAEVRTNSILAIGSKGDMLTVETILARLDEENMNNRKIMTIKLINTPASEIAPVIQQYVTSERQLEIQNITTYAPQSPKEQYQKEIVIVAEPISNTLIISCTPRYYEQIRRIVQRIDERPRVVAIQALIAEVSMNDGNERGFEIGLQDSILFNRSLATTEPIGFLFGSNAALPTGNVSAGKVAAQGISNLGTGRSASTGIGGFTFSASSESLSILMRALAEKDKLRILSKPQLTTLHNMRAVVDIGQRVPFAGASSVSYNGYPTYTTDWQDVGTSLDITPRITSDDQIVMSIYVGRSSLGAEADGITTMMNGDPVKTPKINQEKIQTTLSAMDNQTIIIGGIITEQKEFVNRSIPGLNKIPVIKHFFEYESQKTSRSELLIILTPTIIRNDNDMEKLKQQEYARMHWCLSDVIKLTGKSEMRTLTDSWLTNDVPHIKGTPTKLNESQLPPEEDIKKLIPAKVREE
jgi:type II secretion system protein D